VIGSRALACSGRSAAAAPLRPRAGQEPDEIVKVEGVYPMAFETFDDVAA